MDQPYPNHDLSRLMKKIADKAKEDGVISEDEYSIMEKLSFDVTEYMILFEKSIDDDNIDELEKEKLAELKKKMVYNAMEVASKDGRVTDEEHTLVKELIRILQS